MKFSLSAVVFAIGSMAGSSEAGNLSMRGNTRSASTLMKHSRRLDQNYDYGGGYYYGNNQNQQQYQGQYGNNGQQGQQYQGQYNNNGGNGGGGYNYNNNYNYNNGNNNNNQQEGEEEEQGGEQGEQDYGFLMNYSINLLSCIDGEMVQNYGEENDNNQYETSAVIFRLCPANTCGSSSSEYSEYGCDEGYGDYIIGINTFMELYQRYEEERQQEQEENNDNNNNEENNGGENNNNNGQQQQQQYNSMVAYNSYGVEFDASEYLECREYNADEAMEQAQENGYNYYQNQNNQNGDDGQNNNNQNNQNYQGGYGYYQNVEVFIGPGCTADGKSIGLKLYMNEQCTYGADKAGIDFAQISYGLWDEGLPFSDGGLVSLTCASCSNYNDDGEGEVSELCADAYESSPTQCEDGMNLNNNYYGGQYNNNNNMNNNNNGYYYQQQNQQQDSCEYIENLLSTVYASSLSSAAKDYLDNEYVQKVMSHREAVFITLAVILGITVLAGTYCLYRSFVRKCCADKSNAAAGGDENQKYVAANDDADDEAMMSAKAKIAHAESVLQSATGSNKNNEQLPQEDPEPAVRKSWFT